MDTSNENKKIIISDKNILEQKKLIFQKSFAYHVDEVSTKYKILFTSDFDFTIFNKYNYTTGEKYVSSNDMYNQVAFGGNQEKIFTWLLLKYEEEISIDENIRKEKLLEWITKGLDIIAVPNFPSFSNKKMIELKNDKKFINFKKNMDKDIIIEFLQLLNIKGLNDYIKRGRLSFIANEFFFDEKSKKCIGYNKDIIYWFNKSEHVEKFLHEKYPNIENVFVFVDLDTNYKSIEQLNLDTNKNVIGVWFLYYYPGEIKNEKFQIDNNETLERYKKIFNVNLLIDKGYNYPYELLNIFKK